MVYNNYNNIKKCDRIVIAVLLTKSIKFLNFHRGVMFMPSVLSTLIIGMIFTSILDPKIGILNVFFRGIGLDTLAKQWLTSPQFAFGSVVAVDVWRGIGYIMTIL